MGEVFRKGRKSLESVQVVLTSFALFNWRHWQSRIYIKFVGNFSTKLLYFA